MITSSQTQSSPKVGLFVTCLVDLFRPNVGLSAVQLLVDAGCDVEVPSGQSCCGQPAYNMGEAEGARDLARMTIQSFESFDYIVAPSGSCAGMLKLHYPALFENDPEWSARAQEFSEKVYELVSFLTDVCSVRSVDARLECRAAYHDACSGLRELGIHDQPRHLLASVKGLELLELKEPHACCGFGGTFSVNYGDISNAILEKKTADIRSLGVDLLIAGDIGCLLNIEGKLKRQGLAIQVRHVAEVLAGLAGRVLSPMPGNDENRA